MRQHLKIALAVAAFATASLPALATAQTIEELTVTGRMGPDGQPESLSQVVSYADLDLRAKPDREELRHRIAITARDLCNKLGEPSSAHEPLGQSCRDKAIADAQPQVRMALAAASTQDDTALAYAAPDEGAAYAAPTVSAYSVPASATVADQPATYTTTTVTNGPVADTPANRARFGGPMSHAGRHTDPAGN